MTSGPSATIPGTARPPRTQRPSGTARPGVVRESARVGTWRWDVGADQGHCSPQACTMLGLGAGCRPSLSQLVGRFAPEYRAWLLAVFKRCIDDGSPLDVEAEVERSDGRAWVRLSFEVERDAGGSGARLLGAVQEVPAALSAEPVDLQPGAPLPALVGNLAGMAYRVENAPSWPMEFASDGALDLTGYTPAQLRAGDPAYGDLIHPDDARRVWEQVQDAVGRRERFQLTYRIRTVQGEKWVWEQGAGVFAPDGRLLCIDGYISDITRAKRVQAELNRLNEALENRVRERTAQLQEANAELESFAYSIAHDLRAPMLSLAGFARLLEQGLPAQDRHAHFLRRILGNVQHMSELTDALLSLARLSAVEPQRESVDLGALAHAALLQLAETEPHRRTQVTVAAGMVVQGDRRLLQQVLANLVGNAWKFSRTREVVAIDVGESTVPGTGERIFHVRDRGVGFDMAHASHLFGAFRRLHAADEFEGTGIGLALVRKILARHGGRIWAEAEPDVGATFYFTLPD
jgi:hypothetical protein